MLFNSDLAQKYNVPEEFPGDRLYLTAGILCHQPMMLKPQDNRVLSWSCNDDTWQYLGVTGSGRPIYFLPSCVIPSLYNFVVSCKLYSWRQNCRVFRKTKRVTTWRLTIPFCGRSSSLSASGPVVEQFFLFWVSSSLSFFETRSFFWCHDWFYERDYIIQTLTLRDMLRRWHCDNDIFYWYQAWVASCPARGNARLRLAWFGYGLWDLTPYKKSGKNLCLNLSLPGELHWREWSK